MAANRHAVASGCDVFRDGPRAVAFLRLYSQQCGHDDQLSIPAGRGDRDDAVFPRKNSVWLLVAILISLVGVALLSWGDIGGPQSDRAIVGVGFAGATVLTYTIYIVGVKKAVFPGSIR